MTIKLPLSRGYVALIDDIDRELAKAKWSANLKGADRKPYARRGVYSGPSPRWEQLHRVVMARILGRELERDELVDHVDGDPLNNRRSNLRLATPSQNNANRGKLRTNTSGFKGVYYDKPRGTWRVEVNFQGERRRLGRFRDPKQAHEAYCRAATEIQGEFINTGEKP